MPDETYASYCVAALTAQGIDSTAQGNDLFVYASDYDNVVNLLTGHLGWSVNDAGNLTRYDPAFNTDAVVRVHAVEVLPSLPESRWSDPADSFNL